MPRLAASQDMPRYLNVAEHLRRSILTGRLAARTQIDTEPVLARRHGVSVGTIRKAQDLLIQEGLLIKKQGSGTFVADDAQVSRQILWVCGLDIFGSDLSPFYLRYLQYCRQFAARADFNLTPLLLSHDNPEEALAYCSPVSSRRYAGYIFVGCEYPKHELLRYAIATGLPHMHVTRGRQGSGREAGPGQMVIDYAQALELGVTHLLNRGHRRVDVLVLDPKNMQYLTATRSPWLRGLGRKVRMYAIAPAERMSQVEANGYQAMRHHLLEQSPSSGLLVMDDILARGATRAMLEHRHRLPANLELVVLGSMQDAAPMGLDASYLVHDVEAEAMQTIALLDRQLQHPDKPTDGFVSPFFIKSFEQLQSALGRSGPADATLIQSFSIP